MVLVSRGATPCRSSRTSACSEASCEFSRRLARRCFGAWRSTLDAAANERQLLEELDAHRQGRRQFMQQYYDLEAAFNAERARTDELHARCEASEAAQRQLQEALSFARHSLEGFESHVREVEVLRETAGTLTEQLRRSREREAELERQLQLERERTSTLEMQVSQGEQERHELYEGLERMETVTDSLRSDVVHGCEAVVLLRQRDHQVTALENQLAEARLCLESLSCGAGALLRTADRCGTDLTAVGRAADVDLVASCSQAGTYRSKLLSHFGGFDDLVGVRH